MVKCTLIPKLVVPLGGTKGPTDGGKKLAIGALGKVCLVSDWWLLIMPAGSSSRDSKLEYPNGNWGVENSYPRRAGLWDPRVAPKSHQCLVPVRISLTWVGA